MYALLQNHHHAMIDELVDSTLPTTRAVWRAKVGCERFAGDPRPLAECLAAETAAVREAISS